MTGKQESADFLAAIQLQAEAYRSAYRLRDDYPVDVYIPDWYARKLVERHGSLQAAADSIFRPGAIKLVNQYWHDRQVEVRENIERQQQMQPSVCGINDLTRIAFRAD